MNNQYYVYIMASRSHTLYIGVTNHLERRVFEHKQEITQRFSAKYKTNRLVYFECAGEVNDAIKREKQLKRWSR